jgi:starch synthase
MLILCGQAVGCAGKKAGERVALRAEAQRKRRAQQRKVLYTNPLVLRAGEPCDVYYNPDMTPLRGRPEVYVRGGWNRWTHPDSIPTTKLEPAFSSGVGFLKVCYCWGEEEGNGFTP